MTPAILLAFVAAAACGLGGCVAAHRLLNRRSASHAHCGAPAMEGKGMRKIAPLLISALACGVIMYAVAYLLPTP